MAECLSSIDHNYGNVIAVTCKQFGVALDIDLFEFIQLVAVGFRHLFLHHFTKVTTGFAVQQDLNLRIPSFACGCFSV